VVRVGTRGSAWWHGGRGGHVGWREPLAPIYNIAVLGLMRLALIILLPLQFYSWKISTQLTVVTDCWKGVTCVEFGQQQAHGCGR
jgi:hypothetical protein